MFYDGFLQLDLVLYLRIVPSQHGPVLLQKTPISPYKGLAFLEGLCFSMDKGAILILIREFPGFPNAHHFPPRSAMVRFLMV